MSCKVESQHCEHSGEHVSKQVDNGEHWITAHKGFSKLDTEHSDIIRAALGEQIMIERSSPSINALGQQKFINRLMRAT